MASSITVGSHDDSTKASASDNNFQTIQTAYEATTSITTNNHTNNSESNNPNYHNTAIQQQRQQQQQQSNIIEDQCNNKKSLINQQVQIQQHQHQHQQQQHHLNESHQTRQQQLTSSYQHQQQIHNYQYPQEHATHLGGDIKQQQQHQQQQIQSQQPQQQQLALPLSQQQSQQHSFIDSQYLQQQQSQQQQQQQLNQSTQQYWDYYAQQTPHRLLYAPHHQTLLLAQTQLTTKPGPLSTINENVNTTTNNYIQQNNNNNNNNQSNNKNETTNATEQRFTGHNGNNNAVTYDQNASSTTNIKNNDTNVTTTDQAIANQTNQNSNNNYTRPWEMESKENPASSSVSSHSNNYPNNLIPKSNVEQFSKLPSFQSQFHSYTDSQLLTDLNLNTTITPTIGNGTAHVVAMGNNMVGLSHSLTTPSNLPVNATNVISMESPLTQFSSHNNTSTRFSASLTNFNTPNNAYSHHGYSTAAVAAAVVAQRRTAYPIIQGPWHTQDSGTELMPNTSLTAPVYSEPLLYHSLTSTYTPTVDAVPVLTSSNSLTSLNKQNLSITSNDLNSNPNELATHMRNSTTEVSATNTILPHIPSVMQETNGITSVSTSSSLMDTSSIDVPFKHAAYTVPITISSQHIPHQTQPNTPASTSIPISTPTPTPISTPISTPTPTPTPSTTTAVIPKIEKMLNSPISGLDTRKKERRKNRAHSLESNAESEGSSNVDQSSNQVDAVSSTANFKSPLDGVNVSDRHEENSDKQSKKKRKRCGECIGCQRKDNCGECAPCRNDKSHQICKQRRCEKLTEKKLTYGSDGRTLRTESRRGRGKLRNPTGTTTGATSTLAVHDGKTTVKAEKITTNYAQQQINKTNTGIVESENVLTTTVAQNSSHISPGSTINDTKILSQNSLQSSQTPVNSLSPSQQQSLNKQRVQQQQQHPQQQQQQQQAHDLDTNTKQSEKSEQVSQQVQQHSQQTEQRQLHNQQFQNIQQMQPLHQHQQHFQLQHHQEQQQSLPHDTLQFQQHQVTMREQSQHPMAPMAFYPTWQTDPSQGWQNQFIQQIPQNSSTIPTLNSLDFQAQPYGYPSNGYVQTGLGFDSNYGRAPYVTPVQRYDFQSQQVPNAPLNQAGMQSIGFTPTGVTYGTQVPSVPLSVQQQQHLGDVTDVNKVMSGNETPGYLRVTNAPPHSLHYNGYPGDYGGPEQPQPNQLMNNSTNMNNTTTETLRKSTTNESSQQTFKVSVNNLNETKPLVSPKQPASSQSPKQQPGAQSHISLNQSGDSQSTKESIIASHSQKEYMGTTPLPISPHSNISRQPVEQIQHHNSFIPTSLQSQVESQSQYIADDWNWKNQSLSSNEYEKIKTEEGHVKQQNTEIKSELWNRNDLSSESKICNAQNDNIAFSPLTTSSQQHHNASPFLSYSHHLRNMTMNINATNDRTLQEQRNTQITPHLVQNCLPTQGNGNHLPVTEGGGNQIWKPHNQNFLDKSAPNFPTLTSTQSQPNPTIPVESKKSNRKSKNIRSSNFSNTSESKTVTRDTLLYGNNNSTPNSHLTNVKIEENVSHVSNSPIYSYSSQRSDQNISLIKAEPNMYGPGNVNKLEGYERNYQNFVQYADFCQNETQTQPTQHQASSHYHNHQQDYINYHRNPSYYSVHTTNSEQNYHRYMPSSYQQSTAINAPFVKDSNFRNHHTPTYPHMNYMNELLPKGHVGFHHPNHRISNNSETNNIMPLPANYEMNGPSQPCLPMLPSGYQIIPQDITVPKTGSQHSSTKHKNSYVSTGYPFHGEGGPVAITNSTGFSCCRQGGTKAPTEEHLKDGSCIGMKTKDELIDEENEKNSNNIETKAKSKNSKQENPNEISIKREKINPLFDTSDRLEKGNKTEGPECDCFSSDKAPPEAGTYYTHLGTASKLTDLRKEFEDRCHISGRQLRIEKIVYTGKEGKTSTGCPLAKWVIRRADPEEKVLVIVKKRTGHRCMAAYIVVCMVAWDGISRVDADNAYEKLIPRLNKFGLPTTRRCATNESRTCACQGIDPETSGASYSFGCSWSMYYNGCKYARSKTVRKFRLSVKSEESFIEEHMNILATILAPLFKQICPRSYDNQTKYEREAQDCRLGLKEGKPFSGVTACLDFCAHAHRDLHNMQDGCTVHVALVKPANRDTRNVSDEQLHVLPLYAMDTTDEFENVEGQKEKHRTGAVQVLDKFPCEVRVRSTPLIPCRRHGKKRKDGELPPVLTETENNNVVKNVSNGQSNAEPDNTTPINLPKSNGAFQIKEESNSSGSTPTQITKSKSKTKTNLTSTTNCSSMLSSTPSPSPRSRTPAISNLSPTGSAFTTPPVINNNVQNKNNLNKNNDDSATRNPNQLMSTNTSLMNMATMIDTFTDAQLQSNQISSTVLDSPYSYDYQTGSYIDSRNYYNNWPPPHSHAPTLTNDISNISGIAANGEDNIVVKHPTTPNVTEQPNIAKNQIHHTPDTQHLDTYNTNNYNEMPTAGSQQLTQIQDIRNEFKSCCDEENPDSTTLNNQLTENKLTTLTPMTPIPNTASQHFHHTSYMHKKSPEESFVKPKATAEYQYTPYPNNYSMYASPHSAYSAYDAYQNMNYNYAYHHQAYSMGIYAQQASPQSSSSPNWNMYNHNQIGECSTPYTPTTTTTLTFSSQQNASIPMNTTPHLEQIPLTTKSKVCDSNNIQSPYTCNKTINASQTATFTETDDTKMSDTVLGNNVPYVIPSTVVSTMSNSTINTTSTMSVTSSMPTKTTFSTITEASTPSDITTTIATSTIINTNKVEPIGEVTEICNNLEAFQDSQMGGVAIALNHGSVLIECAKHEMHATTAVRYPNRHEPTRMTLIFYQHRNLNRMRHGIDEWEEKMRVKKINTDLENKEKEQKKLKGDFNCNNSKNDEEKTEDNDDAKTATHCKENKNSKGINNQNNNIAIHETKNTGSKKVKKEVAKKLTNPTRNLDEQKNEKCALRAPTLTTTSWTTLFPMHPCVITGPYQEGSSSPTSTTQQQQIQKQEQ